MFFESLDIHDGPVVEGLEKYETVIAKDQPQYRPLRAIIQGRADPVLKSTGAILTRWTLTPEQREAILQGADVYLEILTFGQPLQPLLLRVGKDVEPDVIRGLMNLPPRQGPALLKIEKSGNVGWMGYDEETKALQVIYTGGGKETGYEYMSVPFEIYDAAQKADSKGRFLASFVAGHFAYRVLLAEEMWPKQDVPRGTGAAG